MITFVGLYDAFINLCDNTTRASDHTIHLTVDDSAKLFKQCECSVTGKFRLTLADVRLRSDTHHCHYLPAELVVNDENYQCEEKSKTLGSVFNKTIGEILTDETITFKKKVQVGKDQEKAQSERDSHSKNRGGKIPD